MDTKPQLRSKMRGRRHTIQISDAPEDIYVIHCAYGDCPNTDQFGDRVVSIFVKNLDSSKSVLVSIEKYASKSGIELNEMKDWHDDLEIAVLDEISDFLKSKSDCNFFFWAEQGKELILDVLQSRFEEINRDSPNKKFADIPASQRWSIKDFLKDRADIDPYDDLKKFIKSNGNGNLVGYQSSSEERVSFDKSQFGKIKTSIAFKVDFLIGLLQSNVTSSDADSSSTLNNRHVEPMDFQKMNLLSFHNKLNIPSIFLFWGFVIAMFGAGFKVSSYFMNEDKKAIIREMNDSKMNHEIQLKSWQKDKKSFKDSISVMNKRIESLENEKIEIEKRLKPIQIDKTKGN